MFLKKISLTNFRNYTKAQLKFSSNLNIFIGENGGGKTSLLEAIYCGLRGRSFHPFIQDQFIQKNENKAQVLLFLKEEHGFSDIQASFFSKGSLRKELVYCGKKATRSFFLKKFPCFIFTEASLKCIRQGPVERRAFIEEFFYSDEQIKIKEDFYRVLRQKKQLLKNYKKSLIGRREFFKLFSAINQKFLEKSYEIILIRLQILNHIFQSADQMSSFFFKSEPVLSFSYQIKENQEIKAKDDFFSFLKQDMESKKDREVEAGIPLSGPQKHDILFLFNGEDSRVFCSKGQQRGYILSLLIGYLQSVPQAFLFLDDALMELDEKIQEKFLRLLEKSHCQVFLTNSNMLSFNIQKTSFFYVKKGQIEQERISK